MNIDIYELDGTPKLYVALPAGKSPPTVINDRQISNLVKAGVSPNGLIAVPTVEEIQSGLNKDGWHVFSTKVEIRESD